MTVTDECRISSLYCAAALACVGHRLIRLERTLDGRGLFIFEGAAAVSAEQFQGGLLEGNLLKLFIELDGLRDELRGMARRAGR
ncbi:MAG: hypothetical protein NTY46_02915 [Candidatus Sumerlaeota bacterium]|nr:hypothetical protein [Candidatus Sumerlaeota bacterium]